MFNMKILNLDFVVFLKLTFVLTVSQGTDIICSDACVNAFSAPVVLLTLVH